jgi:geranylgeranyl diphosphate synthase type I
VHPYAAGSEECLFNYGAVSVKTDVYSALRAQTTAEKSGRADVEPLLLSRHRSTISAFMRAHAAAPNSLSGKMVAYHMGWADKDGREIFVKTGKLVRPSLCLWAAAACGASTAQALPSACAVEWFHNFTLVHDDIQDGDRKRHGRETVWSIWGIPQAINAGDAMQTLAFLSMSAAGTHPERTLRAVKAIGRAGLTVIEGQCLDMHLEARGDATLRAYLRMVNAKTGALLGAALESGALMAGADEERARVFARAGRLLGTAFQMRDDWLGAYGDPAKTGKSAEADARSGKMTFPAVAKLRMGLDEAHAERATRLAAQRYAEKSVRAISRLEMPRSALDEFEEVAYYVATRTA